MQSTFAGIELGKRGLISHTQGLHTVGHNLNSAAVPGYSRQRIEVVAMAALYYPAYNREETAGQIGQGVITERIERVRDVLLDQRILTETNLQYYWSQRDKYILMTEQVYNEPLEFSIRSLMDKFWDSWQELSVHPQEMAARQAVLQRGATMIDSIHRTFERLTQIRNMLENDISGTVTEINSLLAEVADLNGEILKSRGSGDSPNDLLDRRDLLVERLSSLVEITVNREDPDEFTIFTAGKHIVQGRHFELLETTPDSKNEGYSRIFWQNTGDDAHFSGGKLGALLELRDTDVKQEIQKIDLMTVNFIDLVNDIHRKGMSLSDKQGIDFFVEYPFINNVSGNYDRNGDGVYDASYIFRMNGTNILDLKDQVGLSGTLTLSGRDNDVSIDYYPTDTIEDIIKRINLSGSEVTARLDYSGKLSLKGVPSSRSENPDFVIRHVEDSGQFLVGYAGILSDTGAEFAYNWEVPDAISGLRDVDIAVAPLTHPSGWIDVNPVFSQDAGSIVSSFHPGDGEAALAIARLRTETVMLGQISTFDGYYAELVAEIGLKGEQAESALQSEELIVKELVDLRGSISGVNMDEEIANLIKFQHAYAAAAQFISKIDQMLEIIINRLGA